MYILSNNKRKVKAYTRLKHTKHRNIIRSPRYCIGNIEKENPE